MTQPAVATGGATEKRLQSYGEHALHLEKRITRKLCSLRTRVNCSAQRRVLELPVVLRTRRTLHCWHLLTAIRRRNQRGAACTQLCSPPSNQRVATPETMSSCRELFGTSLLLAICRRTPLKVALL